jgi:hypothetical protein
MKIYISVYFFLLPIVMIGCSKSFKAVSLAVEKRQSIGKNDIMTFHDVRLKLYRTGKLDFLKDADTVFMLESFNVEEATFYGKIWTTKDSVQYMYRNNDFVFNTQAPFTTYMCQLINKWDTLAIRENEKLYSNIIPAQWIYGTKITHYKSSPEIYTIRFGRFLKIDRDRFG